MAVPTLSHCALLILAGIGVRRGVVGELSSILLGYKPSKQLRLSQEGFFTLPTDQHATSKTAPFRNFGMLPPVDRGGLPILCFNVVCGCVHPVVMFHFLCDHLFLSMAFSFYKLRCSRRPSWALSRASVPTLKSRHVVRQSAFSY